ncbi:serine hydrolase domain-containing protein [Desulfobotulus sp.]|uniref:serine hydrolase domain-containing protein n=1 Tax=Desulfobotulus sp. TaxID=1940337 RepID=UPI002A363FBE|nr:serine hydrolase domain-containing protein [Desulfobotulus sp.]MDY0164341.1 serine hydrolase domain-containing protein [Desulfobotulus sp.]
MLKHGYRSIIILLLLLMISGCGSSGPSSLPKSQLQQALSQCVATTGITGVTAAVYRGDEAWYGASGYADVDTARGLQPDDQMLIASITKTWAATLVMKQVALGTLNLNMTLEELLPNSGLPHAHAITLHMLLTHTAGLYDFSNESEAFAQAMSADLHREWSENQIYEWIRSGQPGKPGDPWHYSNSNYYVLGPILERATGLSVAQLYDEQIAQPLRLRRSRLEKSGTLEEPYARAYYYDPDQGTIEDAAGWNRSWDWCAGSGVSSARDMAEFGRALFTGQIVPFEMVNLMTAKHAHAVSSQWYGYGLFINPMLEDYGGPIYWHGGDGAGTTTLLAYVPALDTTVFIGINRMDLSDPSPVNAYGAKMELFKRFGRILTGKE